ncbi:PhzF family phenazine biosynthesis protein [Rhodoferax mekongensis]|uniref:PhzF family phenazine biosynthesis protein n=1 Tax=Rhodoferax mekongensis TaxID=3068341 RepID=UPI0028BDFC45|nr:PhzF family phenazine biosynthesis protein [Rhodoferax sp. TBRC 17199]MDT7514244.1 PhzF family phenazine biosynthesis protein [Rhodoferax sp. TBRC 17199]
MPQLRPFAQVDVFTAQPYLGNPLAVVLDGSGLNDAQMQGFARWTNLSETTFLLPPTPEAAAQGADYRVRIFTPGGELPFAGHPTLGSCHAWLEAGGTPQAKDRIVQECAKGLVQICRDDSRLAFAAPSFQRKNPSPGLLAQVAHALGLTAKQIISAQHLSNGTDWLGVLVDDMQSVLQLQPDHPALKNLGVKVGVAAVDSARAAPDSIAAKLEVRAFAALNGINEDPVTGSLNASLAQWLIADEYMPPSYVVHQGTCIQREGRIHIRQDASGQVWVGGDSVTCIRGSATL